MFSSGAVIYTPRCWGVQQCHVGDVYLYGKEIIIKSNEIITYLKGSYGAMDNNKCLTFLDNVASFSTTCLTTMQQRTRKEKKRQGLARQGMARQRTIHSKIPMTEIFRQARCTTLHYTTLHCTALHSTALHCTTPRYATLQYC